MDIGDIFNTLKSDAEVLLLELSPLMRLACDIMLTKGITAFSLLAGIKRFNPRSFLLRGLNWNYGHQQR